MEMTFEKLPAVEGSVACLTCGCGARSDLDLDRQIAVGFGNAGYSRDGQELWSEQEAENGNYHTVGYVESIAKLQANHDWRIYFFAPLYEAEYQRQGDVVWVLVRKSKGFA